MVGVWMMVEIIGVGGEKLWIVRLVVMWQFVREKNDGLWWIFWWFFGGRDLVERREKDNFRWGFELRWMWWFHYFSRELELVVWWRGGGEEQGDLVVWWWVLSGVIVVVWTEAYRSSLTTIEKINLFSFKYFNFLFYIDKLNT